MEKENRRKLLEAGLSNKNLCSPHCAPFFPASTEWYLRYLAVYSTLWFSRKRNTRSCWSWGIL